MHMFLRHYGGGWKDSDPVAPARGIILGSAIGGLLWAIIFLVVWAIL